MIQKTSARHVSTAIAPFRPASASFEHWGQWSGRKHYSLEVVQNPVRARMCGFGDKDRRPLAPAAVAKMVVRREDNSLVDVEDVDCSFFLVTVDLWSADGKHEMNLVLHPSSMDRYVPSHASKPRRHGTSASSPSHRPGHETPTLASRSTPSSSVTYSAHPGDAQPGVTTPVPPATPVYTNQGYFPPEQSSMSEPLNFQSTAPYGSPSDSTPVWGYTAPPPPMDRSTSFPPPVLPSIHSISRNESPGTGINMGTPVTGETWHPDGGSMLPYRAWQTEPPYTAIDNTSSHNVFDSPVVDPSLRALPTHSSPNADGRDNPWSQQQHMSPATDVNCQNAYSAEPFTAVGSSPQFDGSVYTSASYPQHPQTSYYSDAYAQPMQNTPPPPPPPAATIPPLPRHSYTRTLVGPLSANACYLLDEHRKPGIFFLFQDLSVRTEGTFRLRLRLMNVGAPPAPEAGGFRIHTDVSPVLAQTFTDQFTVYSAKRFPGVPDTTALSIALSNQGQKLPLRNRHGSGKGRRRRRDSDGSDDDTDGG